MPISTYAELQAAAGNWLVRTDLTARIPEFIALAEARLNRVLRARLAEAEQALTATAGSRSVALPAGFVEPLGLWLETSGRRTPLRFAEPSLLAVATAAGEPARWSIDADALAFDRPCDQAYGLRLRFLKAWALSNAQPTNALLGAHPDIYLFATLCEAAPFLRDAELSAAYEARLGRAIAEANSCDARSRAPRGLSTELPSLIGERP